MAKEFSRAQRIGDQIQRELAQLIRLEVKDPRLGGLVTVTAVEVSRDSSHAKVFVTVMGAGEPEEGVDPVAQSIKVLNDASGFLRMQLGTRDEAAQRAEPALPLRRKRASWCAAVGTDRAGRQPRPSAR